MELLKRMLQINGLKTIVTLLTRTGRLVNTRQASNCPMSTQ